VIFLWVVIRIPQPWEKDLAHEVCVTLSNMCDQCS